MTDLNIIKSKKKLKEIMQFPISLAICARSQSGKSVLLRKILKEIWKDYFAIYILSPTCLLSDDWEEFKKGKYKKVIDFIDEPSKEFVEGIFETMKELYTEKPNLKKRVLIIADDAQEMYETQGAGDILNKLAYLGRHVGISYMMSAHKWKGLSRLFRINSRQKLFFRVNNNQELKGICDEIQTGTLKSEDAEDMINTHCRNYSSILIKDTDAESSMFLLDRDI